MDVNWSRAWMSIRLIFVGWNPPRPRLSNNGCRLGRMAIGCVLTERVATDVYARCGLESALKLFAARLMC